jgi:3-methyladenine DNA glycosylase AlkD
MEQHASAADAVFLQRFFKTGEGQYGAGDVFVGVRVPKIRLVVKQFRDLPATEIQKLLNSKVHEHRLAALIILTQQYPKASTTQKQAIYELYLKNVYLGRINSWDLVDISAPQIVGEYLQNRPRDILFELAKSDTLWQRRVAILSSFAFIKAGEPEICLELAELLLHDNHDLIQKAVGWMLREIGKRNSRQILLNFLNRHAQEMPRTMLRYSIEHLSPALRVKYMQQKSHS